MDGSEEVIAILAFGAGVVLAAMMVGIGVYLANELLK